MEYSVLTIGIPDELFSNLKKLIVQYRLRFIMSPTVHAAGQMLSHQPFHLLMVNLEYLRSIQQTDWLIGIRRISFVPVICRHITKNYKNAKRCKKLKKAEYTRKTGI